MKKLIYLIIITLLFSVVAQAQKLDETAILINNKPISKGELEEEYKKQITNTNGQVGSIQDFLPSYIHYRLNMEEAYAQGVDTTNEFRKELAPFQLGLTNLYLQDTVAENTLANIIFKRFDNELEINHLFVPFSKPLVFSKDTASYYQQALKLRKKASKKGFDKVETQQRMNTFGVVLNYEEQSGYLGWVRPFFFEQELEEILYSLKLNEITMPIRSENGYHIFQVIGKRPLEGNPVVEQLLFGFPQIPASKSIQDSVYQVALDTYNEIGAKDNYQLVCDEFSAVFETGSRGCLLGELKPGAQVPLPLIEAAHQLQKIGDISKPVLTAYGYHILRLVEKTKAPSKEEVMETVRKALDDKKVLPRLLDLKRERMLRRTNTQINEKVFKNLFALTNKYKADDPLFDQQVKFQDEILISIDGGAKEYTVKEFLAFKSVMVDMVDPKAQDALSLVKIEPMVTYNLSSDILKSYFNSYLYTVLTKYEKATLAEKNPDYAQSLENISKGILFSMLQEKEIWKKSKEDTKSLEDLFNKDKDKYKFDSEMAKGWIVLSKQEELIPQIETQLKADRDVTPASLRKAYNSEGIMVSVEKGIWRRGENPYVDYVIFGAEDKPTSKIFPHFTVLASRVLAPQEYLDVREQVEADYQKKLEKEWKIYLDKKYKVEINNAVIQEIK